MIQSFKDASVDYLKLGPSSTSSWQPWDVCDLFRGTKSGMAKVVKEGIDVEDDLLRRSLMNYLAEFHSSYPAISLTHNFKNKILYSTMLIVYTLKKYLRPHQMTIGFVRAGNQSNICVDVNNNLRIQVSMFRENLFVEKRLSIAKL